MKRILISLCVLLSFAGCEYKDIVGDDATFQKRYITHYLYPNAIRVVSSSKNIFRIEFIGESISNRNNPKSYKLLSEYFGDTSYNRYVGGGPYGNEVIAEPLSFIEIRTLQDYDAKHKAGDVANDLVRVSCRSVYDFIQSGYRNEEVEQIESFFGMQRVHNIQLAEILKWSSSPNYADCTFISPPTAGGEYDFEIKVKVGEKILSTVATLTWE